MSSLLSKLHIFVFIYLAFGVYTKWVEHQEKLEAEQGQKPVLEAKIRKSKKEKKQLRNYLKDVESAKGRIELVAKEIENLQKKLPDTIDDTENLSKLKKIAEEINVKNIYLTPMNEIEKGFYIAKRYNIKASGTYLQFLLFVEKVGAESSILNIKRLFLENVQKKQRGRFQIINGDIIVETYRYNKSYRESRGIEQIENDFKKKKVKPKPKKRSRKRRKKS
jgi:Tfp pilus assembly protein PilO